MATTSMAGLERGGEGGKEGRNILSRRGTPRLRTLVVFWADVSCEADVAR